MMRSKRRYPPAKLTLAFFSSLLSFSLVIPCSAQDEIATMRTSFNTVARNYRNAIRPYLDDKDQAILNDIQFVFEPSFVLNAAAYRNQGDRKIVVAFGWVEMAYQLILGATASGEYGKDKCFIRYIESVASTVLTNTTNANAGESLQLVPPFVRFATMQNVAACRGMSLAKINNSNVLSTVAKRMDSAMAVILGHEVAHHIHGDVDHTPVSQAASRRAEASADRWSIERAFDIRINPMGADVVLLLYAMIGASDREGELRSSHPANIRRYAEFLNGIEEKMEDTEWYESKFGAPPSAEVIAELQRLKERVQAYVPQ